MRPFIFAIALLLLSAPALADRATECRRQCGDDAACYRRCMGYSYGPSYYGYPSGGGGHPHAYRRAPSSVSAPKTAPEAEAPGAEPPTRAPTAEPQAPKAQRPTASRSSDRSSSGRPSILGTAYDFLYAPGAETAGYGLYSYVILPRPSGRAVAFLSELVGRFPAASEVAEFEGSDQHPLHPDQGGLPPAGPLPCRCRSRNHQNLSR